MRDAAVAFAGSLLIHALACVALAVGLGSPDAPSVTAVTLDLASVEIGFAGRERRDSAAAAPAAAECRNEVRTDFLPPPSEVPVSSAPPALAVPPQPSLDSGLRPEVEFAMEAASCPQVSQTSPADSAESDRARLDAPPRPLRPIRPVYPRRARQHREEGDVTLLFAVGETGEADQVQVMVSSGFPDLDDAAVMAVRTARFKPARRGDTCVSATARLTLSFRLR